MDPTVAQIGVRSRCGLLSEPDFDCYPNGEKVRIQLILKIVFFLCASIVFGSAAWSQERASAIASEETASGAASAQAKPQSPAKAKASGEEAEANTAEAADALQKATQNPVASLISVPVQENFNFGVNPGYRTQNVVNIQPVVPVGISKDWNLIVRWIAPIVYQPIPNAPGTPETGEYGLGDMVPTFFVSPKKPGKLIWGVGPVFQLPTATNTYLGQGKLGLGPSIVVLTQPGHWTLGALANNVWSVAGDGSRPAVNQFLLQYFINYNLKKGYFITWQPTLTANWEATNGNTWTVPFGGGIGRIMKLGNQPVSLTAQFYGNAVHPEGTSSWSFRVQMAFLFPKLSNAQKEMLLKKKLNELEAQQPQKN